MRQFGRDRPLRGNASERRTSMVHLSRRENHKRLFLNVFQYWHGCCNVQPDILICRGTVGLQQD
jgi:hypothetical protein